MRSFRRTLSLLPFLALAACTETGLEPPTPEEPIPAPTYASLSVGPRHACALDIEGRAFCWGGGSSGELGDGGTSDSESPVLVRTAARFVEVDVGWLHSCGLTGDGELWCWGLVRAAGERLVPVRIGPADVRFTQISLGVWISLCALADTGELYCVPSFDQSLQRVAGDQVWASVSAGDSHVCAVTVAGAGFCWGRNDYRQLGVDPWPQQPLPLGAPDDEPWLELVAGTSFTCGTTTAPRTLCWGSPDRLVFGTDTFTSSEDVFWGISEPVAFLDGEIAVTGLQPALTGYWESDRRAVCGFVELGRVIPVCWGDGQPLTHMGFGLYDWKEIELGQDFGCGVTNGGRVYCWEPIPVTEPWFEGANRVVSRLVHPGIEFRELPAPETDWREP